MTPFSELRTSRLVAAFKEISIADSIRICGIPSEEISTGEFLKSVVIASSIPFSDWTVAERLFSIIHYIGHISEDGANFRLGDGTVSDYIQYGHEYKPEPTVEKEIAGDSWKVTHFLGRFAESIERIEGHFDLHKGMHWKVGEMAARLRNNSDPEEIPDVNIDDWMIERMQVLLSYPDSDFYELSDFMSDSSDSMMHLLDITVSPKGGLVCHPKQEGESGNLPPATFPCDTCISNRTKNLFQIFGEFSD